MPRHTASSSPWRVDTVVKSDDYAFLTTAGNSTMTTTIPGMSLSPPSSKFSGWSARRAFGRVVSSRSHAAVAPVDAVVRKQPQPAPYYAKQSSSCSVGSDRTTPSPPMALPLQLTQRRHQNMTDRSSTLTDPVAVTLLAQEAAQQPQQHQQQPSGRQDWFLPNNDERMQLKFSPPPHTVLSRPTAIRPMTTQR
jgi:hypothetical protein